MAQRDFEDPDAGCTETLSSNTTYEELKSLVQDELIHIQEDLIIEGYVISSDIAGNFFKTLIIQDKFNGVSQGMQLEIELRDSHLFYPMGSRIFVKLKGLYLGKSKDSYKIGGAINSFGSLAIGRIPAPSVDDHIIVSCDGPVSIESKIIRIDSLNAIYLNTLVELMDVEFVDEVLGQPYALLEEETKRLIRDCTGSELAIENSGYSDFQSKELPKGNGLIKGVLIQDGKNFNLKIRDTFDIAFEKERCPNYGNFVSADSILISEIADPDNDSRARFIELYNSSNEDISLNGWSLGRYTNDNVELSSLIDLSGTIIPNKSTLVLSTDAVAFENVYGNVPVLEVASISAADSNGDDNIDLIDPFGKIIDRFGMPGEDGTGTNHEFEDGGAFRSKEIQKGNPDYIFEEWVLYNDSGAEGTINRPLIAPADYTPGKH